MQPLVCSWTNAQRTATNNEAVINNQPAPPPLKRRTPEKNMTSSPEIAALINKTNFLLVGAGNFVLLKI